MTKTRPRNGRSQMFWRFLMDNPTVVLVWQRFQATLPMDLTILLRRVREHPPEDVRL